MARPVLKKVHAVPFQTQVAVNNVKRLNWLYIQQSTRRFASSNVTKGHHTTTSFKASTMNVILGLLRGYGRLQQRRPYLAQISTMATVFFTGDLSAQAVSSRRFQTKEYEPVRGLRSALIGSIWSIPAYHWFIWLGRHFQYSSWISTIGTKILIQQSMFVPVVNTYFFGMQTLLAGGTLQDANRRVQTGVPVSWKNSWKMWPMVTAISFTYIPPQYRSVFGSLFATVWQTYLSWLNQRVERESFCCIETRHCSMPSIG